MKTTRFVFVMILCLISFHNYSWNALSFVQAPINEAGEVQIPDGAVVRSEAEETDALIESEEKSIYSIHIFYSAAA